MSNTIGYDLEGFANSAVTKTVTTSVSSDIALYLPFDSDLNDDSTNSHTVTNSGSVAVSTSVKKYGAGSADIPAAADYLEISGGQFDFGSNDFTIEGWFYDDGSGGSRNVALDYRLSGGGAAGSGSETFGFFFYLNSAGNGQFFIGLADDAANLGVWPMFSSSSLAISTNTWTHYAFTREGSTFRAFKGGSLIATQTGVTSAVGSSGGSAILRIGGGHDGSSSYGMAGYIDDLRIINGTALYTAAFTPPTSAVGLTADVTNTTVDQKFLSSVWDSDDVSEKMADGTWIRNDSTSGTNPAGVVVQGAGLEVEGHRWYVAPSGPGVGGGSPITINTIGGGGGVSPPAPGAYGGYTTAVVPIAPGTSLNVVVGIRGFQNGAASPTAQGGAGGLPAPYPGGNVGSGGGFSGVFEGPLSQANALVIAGGAGGGGYGSHTTGGLFHGGGPQGSPGMSNGGTGPPERWGFGGTQSAGGAGGSSPSPSGTNDGQDGSALQGGNGNGPAGGQGGGGGGGYFGGGGGGWRASDGIGGGGGGSGYITPAANSGTSTQGGANGSLPPGLAGQQYGYGGWPQANHGAVEIIDGAGPTVYTYTGSIQTHTVT